MDKVREYELDSNEFDTQIKEIRHALSFIYVQLVYKFQGYIIWRGKNCSVVI